jgi:allophanate hydrolase
VAALAARLHAASNLPLGATVWTNPDVAVASGDGQDDWIELAVVGAHLSGMALNGDLRKLGARFCRAVKTIPAYQLFALAGQAIPKPGLLRVSDGRGTSIEIEVWSLPPAAFGGFVAGIPSPLGIGTVNLADGTAPKGFLVEAAGLAGARDISALGGWRTYAEAGFRG